ncbi:MAG: hypothetical protein M0C28_07145 [Candidatus Moduliflexus flocculans]|nr:hypothetical protein [Candidatus Moduliflexus flocculans]
MTRRAAPPARGPAVLVLARPPDRSASRRDNTPAPAGDFLHEDVLLGPLGPARRHASRTSWREQFEKDDGSPLQVRPDRPRRRRQGREVRPLRRPVRVRRPTSGSSTTSRRDRPGASSPGPSSSSAARPTAAFPGLETYWKQGGDMSVVSRYAYDKGRYGRDRDPGPDALGDERVLPVQAARSISRRELAEIK